MDGGFWPPIPIGTDEGGIWYKTHPTDGFSHLLSELLFSFCTRTTCGTKNEIIVQFLYQDGHVWYKPTFSFFVPHVVLVQKLNNNSHKKCKSKSPKKTRLQKTVLPIPTKISFRTVPVRTDLERIYSYVGLEITYLLMYFWTRPYRRRFRTNPYNVTLTVGGSRFWFWVPFRRNGIKIGINLNYDWTTLLHFLFQPGRGPKWKRINILFWNCLFFFPHLNVWVKIGKCLDMITYHFFNEIASRPFQTSNNTTWREGRWTGAGNHVLTSDYRVFLTGDRQTKCLDGDRQKTVWCLDQHELRYLRDGRTENSLCPVEGAANLVPVRLRCLSVRHMKPHMYPRTSAPSLMSTRTCMWSMRSCGARDSVNLLEYEAGTPMSSPLRFVILSSKWFFLFSTFDPPNFVLEPKIETTFFHVLGRLRRNKKCQ
jgi:hypothetical protein